MTDPQDLSRKHNHAAHAHARRLGQSANGALRIFVLLAIAFAASTAAAASPDPVKTRVYIDHAWDTLTRSLDDCSALADSKVSTHSVLYLPAQLPVSEELRGIAKRCGVGLRSLPRTIGKLGDIDPTQLPVQGLLYLPHPYVVPGGFFNEMYGWDSYFIVLGLVADHRSGLARDMVDNALFEVEYYGGVLNANRTYYLSRSQPPFLAAMMSAVLGDPASFHGNADRQAWLAQAYPLAVRNHDIWTRTEHLAGDTGLARYFDLGSGPVLEARDADYYRGVIKWLLAHPSENPGYLVKASRHPDDAEAAHLKSASCDVRSSKVCADAWLGGFRLSADYYLGDRAMRESGFDVNFHFGPFAGSTHHYAAVGLNSLLYRYETDLHDFALQLGKPAEAAHWANVAQARKQAMDRYLWHPDTGIYMDYDFVAGKPATHPYITAFYPLWAHAASVQQAGAARKHLSIFERSGGLAMDDQPSGAQWDEPFGWAPTNWLAISGLDAYRYHDDARRLAGKFCATVDRGVATDGTIREKYNMVLGNADVHISAGYTQNVVGFGWTNGVYLKLQELLHGDAMPASEISADNTMK
ncbi:trehalase family glycosidase [Rhodanobacter sp. B04]|uniref:trehalase family glycosidase n=1 Tax=Rhodanobacter sp. B04 TaxID=1945860 RepID=UPI000986FA50|nr:trehalase family glycosidase [Rhodanobacter sp. B04]